MPWHMLGSPSIQLGALGGALRAAGIACRTHSLYLEFLDFLAGCEAQHGFSLADYGEVASRWENAGAGDWVFAVAPARDVSRADDERFAAFLRSRGMTKELVRRLRALRALVPSFLERCADEILATEPAAVGFTNVYSQAWSSAALAHVLKRRNPSLPIMLGGSACEGVMGVALLKAFPQLDFVVRGEAEDLLPELARALIAGTSPPRSPGLCFRENEEIVEVPEQRAAARIAMDELSAPVYDEYFERLSASRLASVVLPQVPYESSRGCWWGVKTHCTFCGLNGLEMTFRSKSASRVLDDISALAARHGVLDFIMVDNILDLRYFATLLPGLIERGHDLSFFYETKANLTEIQVRTLRDAGVRSIQPGIESLSTPTLELMGKGVTALQNIRLLKWCTRYGIHVIWNLLYGFPRESPQEYARMAALVPSLVHLPPPSLSELAVYRFSPYHDDPGRHGLRLRGPLPHYRLLYDLDDVDLADLALVFEHVHEDARDPEAYIRDLREKVERWKRDADRNRGALTYRRGPGVLVITDTRTTTCAGLTRYTLGETEAAVYLACEAGATPRSILARLEGLSSSPDEGELERLLQDFVEARLAYEEGGRYLSLALPNGVSSREALATPPSHRSSSSEDPARGR